MPLPTDGIAVPGLQTTRAGRGRGDGTRRTMAREMLCVPRVRGRVRSRGEVLCEAG